MRTIVSAIILTLAILGTIFSNGCKTCSSPLINVADQIQHNIPNGWNVDASNNVIRIQSKKELTMILAWQLPVSADSSEAFQKYSETLKYEVVLSFVPRLTESELEYLREQRRPYEKNLQGNHMTNVTQSLHALEKIPLPSYYFDNYSIFVARPILNGENYPAARQVQQLMDSLKIIFHEY